MPLTVSTDSVSSTAIAWFVAGAARGSVSSGRHSATSTRRCAGVSATGGAAPVSRVPAAVASGPHTSITVGVTVIEVCGPEATAAGTRDSGVAQPPVALTPAQRRALTALCRPLLADPRAAPATNQAIAEELSLSVETVKGTMSALFERYGLSALPQNEKRAVLAQRALSDARSG